MEIEELNELRKSIEGPLEEIKREIEVELLKMLKKRDFCDEKFQSFLERLDRINKALVAVDLLCLLLQILIQKANVPRNVAES